MNNDKVLIGAAILAGAFVGWKLGTEPSGAPAAVTLLDRTALARLSDAAAPHTRTRDPAQVDAVVLHQMGFSRGNDPARYDAVTAHYKVLPNGLVIVSHPWSTRLPAANGFNSRSVSVEFAGNLPKRIGSRDPRDFWSPQTHGMNNLTPAAAASGQALMRYLYKRGIRYVFAHAQSAPKGLDPGPAVWFFVGEYAKRLGMSDGGKDYHIGGGGPIPANWRRGGKLAAA